MRLVQMGDYPKLATAELDWIIPYVLPRPATITLLGSPKAGKSLFATQLCRGIAMGEPFLHFTPVRPFKCLYLQFDTSPTVWKQMIQGLEDSGLNFGGDFYIPHPDDFPRPFSISQPQCREAIQQCLDAAKPDVVVLDVLRELHAYDENDSTQMRHLSEQLDTLFAKYTVIQLHHTKKLSHDFDPRNIVNASRGSSYVIGKCDAYWLLHQGTLYMVPRFGMPVQYTVSIGEGGVYTCDTPTSPVASLADGLHDLIERHPGKSMATIFEEEEEALQAMGITSLRTFYRRLGSVL